MTKKMLYRLIINIATWIKMSFFNLMRFIICPQIN